MYLIFFVGCSILPQKVTASKWYNTTITSPSYPQNYANNLECRWLIEVGSSLLIGGYIVKVTFNDFQLQGGSFSRCYSFDDELKFYDGTSTAYNLLGSYCGTVHPEVIYSTGRYLYVKFDSGRATTRRGFSINVLTVAEGNVLMLNIYIKFSGTCIPSDSKSIKKTLSHQ